MPSHAGLFTAFTGCVLAIDNDNRLTLHPKDHQPGLRDKLRANGEFWLCRDDGVVFLYDNQEYNIWIETRGFSDGALEHSLLLGPAVTDAWPPGYHSTGLSPSFLAETTVIPSWPLTTRPGG
ncbi:hypothetical protein ASPNIDRAFT_42206 [Aspergillus niger ATCC 1015]|uniref:Uncharacterized protein n=1 Tax=Aspergillus niger (strain ATCC 1015 / CBS 113.46 / FGSC A1144 / LSHB Ac4 / NCTC 3858a / NRRL 328 / USDA 3528.7) TaxID=380704 RepID=G3XW34_ASPNA|nr:hypothetical protein ASPNIDRAFT_42206 [Aspergillus niger ATCC 1015]